MNQNNLLYSFPLIHPLIEHMEKKLFVGNLSFGTTEQMLRDAFAQAGAVESASIITDRDSGRSKGFGFVEMATSDEAQKAITLFNGQELDGRPLTVNIARPKVAREGGSFGSGF